MNHKFELSILENTCRICLGKIETGVCLFNESNESKDILDKVYMCFQLILEEEKHLPRIICSICVSELEGANNFRLKCISFQSKLITLYDYFSSQNKDIKFTHNRQETSPDKDNEHDTEKSLHNYNSTYKCKICNKVFQTAEILLSHNIRIHLNETSKSKVKYVGGRRYQCTVCPYSTPHSKTLTNHIRKHTGEKPYKCDCGKSFTQQSNLDAHLKTHSSGYDYTCATCGKQFKLVTTLKNHQRVHKSPSYSCTICKKVLKTRISLSDHMKRHNNIRNYSCEVCGANFVTSSEMLNHKRSHKLEMKVECHLCGYKTTAKTNLIMHIKRHAGEKCHKCNICSTSFYTASEVRRHLRVHTRDKPYVCSICTQKFTHSSSLNKHMHTVHNLTFKWADVKKKEQQTTSENINQTINLKCNSKLNSSLVVGHFDL